jgi:hypothetical protein
MEDWVKNLLANQQQLVQNSGLQPETVSRLQQFADAQKEKARFTGFSEAPKPQTNNAGNEGLNKLAGALASKGGVQAHDATSGMFGKATDNLGGISVNPDNTLKLDNVGVLGQNALHDKDNIEFAKQLEMFQRRG